MQQDTRRSLRPETIGTAPTDPDAFLRWASERPREEGKYELSRGRVTRTRDHASRAHSRVCVNILRALYPVLVREHFDVGLTNFAVRSRVGFRTPDVLVDRAGGDLSEMFTSMPLLIAEVLSPSTIGIDFTEKLEEYSAIETLQTYLICSQDEPRAWVWSRQADGSWPRLPTELAGREGTISLGGLGVDIAMAAIFRGIPDAPTVA